MPAPPSLPLFSLLSAEADADQRPAGYNLIPAIPFPVVLSSKKPCNRLRETLGQNEGWPPEQESWQSRGRL
jgi:hypothetical protein